MDFAKLSVSPNTFTFHLIHPTEGTELEATMTVYGALSDVVKKHQSQVLRQLQKREFENSRSRKQNYRTLTEMEQDAIENAIVRIADWHGIEWEGKDLEFTQENARKLLNACPWMREQIIEQSENLGNFLAA
ncbi:hypothetical protein [Avibacterium volantium]|uniref:hypothetical protein n=1 Tax=Avibacterium volantium TaxID=762 RepID=UPI003BF80D76